MPEKKIVVEFCIKAYEQRILELRASLITVKDAVINAPGSTVSWSDTTKFQEGNLAAGIQERVSEFERDFSELKALESSISADKNTVGEGSLVAIQNIKTNEIAHYLVVPGNGGMHFSVDAIEIITVSSGAPLVKALYSRKMGDSITIKDKSYKIISVY